MLQECQESSDWCGSSEEILVRIARGGDGIGKRGELMLKNEAKNIVVMLLPNMVRMLFVFIIERIS